MSAVHAWLLVVSTLPILGPVQADGRLYSRFVAEANRVKKEQLLNEIVSQPNAGPRLLGIASRTDNMVTKWMCIRGLGQLKYQDAAPFLIKNLDHPHAYVRANAARALGEMRASSATSDLIRLLSREKHGGVIEQTVLALQWLDARDAVPAMKGVALHTSSQTCCWVLQAIGVLGARQDTPFIAQYLYSRDLSAGMCAARAIEVIAGVDFGFPPRHGPMSPHQPVERARQWWGINRARF